MLGRLWAALGLTGVYSGCVMMGEPPLLVSGLASNYFQIRALLSTPDFGLRALHRMYLHTLYTNTRTMVAVALAGGPRSSVDT